MSDSLSGVIIPLIIPVDAPSSLATGVQALAASLESTEFSSACLQLQQSFCYLTWHFADYTARHLHHLGLEHTPCSPFGHARLEQHLQSLQTNLDKLAEAADAHPEVGDVFRVFYVGGLRARHSSPRRHTRLLGLGGQSIRGYRSVLEWCRLEPGDEEFSGELRCQRELRRYLPILREWLDSSSGHFRQIKTYDWFDQTSTNPDETGEATSASPPPAASAPAEALASLKSAPAETPAVISLSNFPTPPLLACHQLRFEEQIAANSPEAYVTLGRLSGLAVQYIFAIAGAALRSIGQLDPALEKRLDTGLTLRQKQTSLTFLFKALGQHRNENPMLELVARCVQAPTGGKLAEFLTGTWGGGHTFAEFCLETAKAEPPPLWQERFLPGVRAWLQQFAAWFAQAEHYFQTPNEQGFVSFTVQSGDEHLEVDRKALQLDTAALRISSVELKQLLTPPVRGETTEVAEPPKVLPEKVEAARPKTTPTAKAESAAQEAAKTEPPQTEPTAKEPAKTEPAKAAPAAKATPAAKEPAKTEPAKAAPAAKEPAKTEPAKAPAAKAEPVKAEPAKAEPAAEEGSQAAPAKAEPAKAETVKAKPAAEEDTKAEPAKEEPAKAEPASKKAAKAEPAAEQDTKAEPVKEEPAKAEPASKKAAKAEPAAQEETKAEPVKEEPAKAEPAPQKAAKAEPAAQEETKAEPVKEVPAKAEPASKKAAKADPAAQEDAKDEPAKAAESTKEPAVAKVTPKTETAKTATAAKKTPAEPADSTPAVEGTVKGTAAKEASSASPTEAAPATSEPTKAEPEKAEPVASKAVTSPVQADQAEDAPEAPTPRAEVVAAATDSPVQELLATATAISIDVEEPCSPPVSLSDEPQTSAQLDWSGPTLALELWDQSVETRAAEPLLKLVAFLVQYSSGLAAEWRELEDKAAAPDIAAAVDQLRDRLQTQDDTPVLAPLGASSDADSLSHWLFQPELKQWLCQQRDYRPEIQTWTGRWLEVLQPFFKDSEQLFEEPTACGSLEGVVAYQDRFLEFVDHPLFVGPLSGDFWTVASEPDAEGPSEAPQGPAAEVEIAAAEAPAAEAAAPAQVATQVAAPPKEDEAPDLSALPACVTEYYFDLWCGELGCEGLAAALEFSIQYFAGLLASVAIQAGAVEASHLGAWRSDSNLLQRQEMIQQILQATTEAEHETLISLREIFLGPIFGPTWEREAADLPSLAFALRSGEAEERDRALAIVTRWVEASQKLLGTLENLAEPIDAKGHLEVVIQQDDSFFELVEPEYAVNLVPPGYEAWQDLPCYRNLSARYGSQELLGKSDGSQELSGSAVADDSEDFFSAPSAHNYNDKLMEALFKEPEPAPTAKLESPKHKPQLVQEEEKPVAAAPRSEYQLNSVLEQLLQKPAEEEAPPPPPPAPNPEEKEAPAPVTARLENKPPARLDAPAATEKQPEFIVVDPPKLEYIINYEGKEGQIHTGKIQLKNVGGGNLKGTVKSNHPCLRVSPSVFRSNDAELSYWVDDSDRPSNLQKIGLSFHFSGQKVEVPMEKLLPDKKFKQLATKVLGFVKNLRQKG